eukprot:6310488-Amphidinium_carterae.1
MARSGSKCPEHALENYACNILLMSRVVNRFSLRLFMLQRYPRASIGQITRWRMAWQVFRTVLTIKLSVGGHEGGS